MSFQNIGTIGDLLKGNSPIPPREQVEAMKYQHNPVDNWISVIQKVSYVAHVPGHKNSSGEAAPWVIKDHDGGKILSSHKTEAEAKKHLQNMHIHSGNINSIDDLLEIYKISADEKETKEEKNDTDKEEGFDLSSVINVDDLISTVKEFDEENVHHSLQKLFLGKIDDISIYSVNGDYVKEVMGKIQFVEAGNWMAYPDFIPEKEIWLDNNLNVGDHAPNMLHEFLESYLMKEVGLQYDNSDKENDLNYAHPNANKVELEYRKLND